MFGCKAYLLQLSSTSMTFCKKASKFQSRIGAIKYPESSAEVKVLSRDFPEIRRVFRTS